MELINLNKTYTERWFRQRPKLNWRTEPFCKAVWQTLGPFKTLIDLGCGIGEFIAYFHRTHSVLSVGFDGSENSLTHMASGATIYLHDMRNPISWGHVNMFDLCMCLEVAEHIEPEFANMIVDNCCEVSDLILFTAAKPGQEGLGHVNLQHPEYWIGKFRSRGYVHRSDKVLALRLWLENWKHKKGIKAYYDNAMVFEKWISP
jgi:SAM-dependent methyltransferase